MIKSKKWHGGQQEEYETQHFGFGRQRMQIALHQMIESKIVNNVREMEKYLLIKLKVEGSDKNCIQEACNKLIGLYCSRAETSLNVIDDEISKMLSIPDNILLPEDEDQLQQIDETEYETLRNEVSDLKKRVERAALMEALLSAEEEELKKAETACEVAKVSMGAVSSWSKVLEDNARLVEYVESETADLKVSAPFINSDNRTNF